MGDPIPPSLPPSRAAGAQSVPSPLVNEGPPFIAQTYTFVWQSYTFIQQPYKFIWQSNQTLREGKCDAEGEESAAGRPPGPHPSPGGADFPWLRALPGAELAQGPQDRDTLLGEEFMRCKWLSREMQSRDCLWESLSAFPLCQRMLLSPPHHTGIIPVLQEASRDKEIPAVNPFCLRFQPSGQDPVVT